MLQAPYLPVHRPIDLLKHGKSACLGRQDTSSSGQVAAEEQISLEPALMPQEFQVSCDSTTRPPDDQQLGRHACRAKQQARILPGPVIIRD